ncbi:MAG: TadE/TadG family type IV pilus assembly protein [Pseudomonadota bacterium]
MSWLSYLQPPKIVRRFNKSEDGVTAVEFAIIGGPFFLLIFAIIEASLFFFASQYLETIIDDTTRLFRTGQFNTTTTEDQFRTEFCSRLAVLFECDDVRTELQVAATFADLQDPSAPDDDGNLPGNGYPGTGPGARQIIQLSAQYKWPVFTNFAAPLLHTPGGDYALIQVVSVTRTEPFE